MADAVGDIELFVGIVDAGSISAAALAMASSPPAVSRRLASLEARLGVRLADRSARRFRLTEEGRLYFERGRMLLHTLRDLEAEVATRGSSAKGRLLVGAPVEIGRDRIGSLLATFVDRHPGVQAHLTLSDAGLEVGEDALDVALRFGQPADQGLLSRKIATVRRLICAAPSYIERRGLPSHPDDLLFHDCLCLTRRHGIPDPWRFRSDDGYRDITVTGRLSSSSGDVLHRWCLDGRGISREAEWDVADDLARGRLTELLPGAWCDSVNLFATYLPGQPVAPRIRLFVEFVAASLKASACAP